MAFGSLHNTPVEHRRFIALSIYMYTAVCGAGRQRCTVSPLSHLLSPAFIDSNHIIDIYLSFACVLVCMFVCAGMVVCAYAYLYFPWGYCSVSARMFVGMCMSETCYCSPPPPSTTPLIVPLMTECIIPSSPSQKN